MGVFQLARDGYWFLFFVFQPATKQQNNIQHPPLQVAMRIVSTIVLMWVSRFAHFARASSSSNTSAFVVSSNGAVNRAASSSSRTMVSDPDYPGTAVERMMNVRKRVSELTKEDLSGPWEEVRRKILWAG